MQWAESNLKDGFVPNEEGKVRACVPIQRPLGTFYCDATQITTGLKLSRAAFQQGTPILIFVFDSYGSQKILTLVSINLLYNVSLFCHQLLSDLFRPPPAKAGGWPYSVWPFLYLLIKRSASESQHHWQAHIAKETKVKATIGGLLQNFLPQVVALILSLQGIFKACSNETVLLWRLLTSLVTPNSGIKVNAKEECQGWMRRAEPRANAKST